MSLRGFTWIMAAAALVAFWLWAIAAFGSTGDREALRELGRVNQSVNAERRSNEPWPLDPQDGVWDCENYAGLKRDRLLYLGWGHGDLRTWYVRTSRGEAHVVLEARLPSGRRVLLDNLTPWLVDREDSHYTDWSRIYVMRQEYR